MGAPAQWWTEISILSLTNGRRLCSASTSGSAPVRVRPAAYRCCGDVGGQADVATVVDGRDPIGGGISGVPVGVGVGGRRVLFDEDAPAGGVVVGGILGGIFDLVPGDHGTAVALGGGPGQVDLPRGLRDGGREVRRRPGGGRDGREGGEEQQQRGCQSISQARKRVIEVAGTRDLIGILLGLLG